MNDYPVFNKRLQKSRSNYTFGSRNLQRAEEWFAERKKVKESPVTPSPANSVPPGFSSSMLKQTQQTQQTPKPECNVCFRVPSVPTSLECCKKPACFSCTEEYISVNNRCPSCRKVVNANLYDLYDGCDLVIPSYDEFEFYQLLKLEPITPLNHLLPAY
jgi:hypothetical protein